MRASSTSSSSSYERTMVVITGGTRGIGFALAQECIQNGVGAVVIASRDAKRTDDAVEALREMTTSTTTEVVGLKCDVGDAKDVERLEAETRRLSKDYDVVQWINSAGMVTKNAPLHEVETDEIIAVTRANLIGPLLCCRAVLRLAVEAEGARRFVAWNFGFSDWGANLSKSAATHKATKTGLTQLTKSLNADVASMRAAGGASSSLRCEFHQLSPGLALTKLLLGNGNANPISKRIFNALAEEPEVIAANLTPRILSVEEGSTHAVEFLTPMDAVTRVLAELPRVVSNAGGRHFDSTGRRVSSSDGNYDVDGVRKLPFDD